MCKPSYTILHLLRSADKLFMAMQSVSDAISLVVALGESLGKLSLMSTDNMDAVIDALPLTREAKPVVTPAGRYAAFLGA